MQQLSFLEAPGPDSAVPVWNALDHEQRAKVITMLAHPADREDDHGCGAGARS